MRILIDMNLTPRWASYLESAGHEGQHWASLGSPLAKDRQIFEYARVHQYTLLTNDLDFPQILAHTGAGKPSVINSPR